MALCRIPILNYRVVIQSQVIDACLLIVASLSGQIPNGSS